MMTFPVPLQAVNLYSPAEFVAAFGDVAEHSPWVAELAAGSRPFTSREAMVSAFVGAIGTAGRAAQLALIRAHPDLAGKAALAGEVADDSRREQAGAGLDQLTADEFARFNQLNDRYRTTFGFPFIFAVKGATKQMILAAFEARVANDPESEFATALAQVCRIFRFRIEDRVQM